MEPARTMHENLEHAMEALLQAIALQQSDSLPAALAALDRAIALSPALLPARVMRSDLLAALGRFIEAVDNLDDCQRRMPDADALKEQRQALLAQALAHSEAAGSDPQALLERAYLQLLAGLPEDALRSLQSLLAVQPEHASALNNAGNALFALWRTDEAIVHYERALALCPEDVDTRFNLGNALQRRGRLTEAEACYQQVLTRQAGFAEAQMELAHCALMQGHWRAGWQAMEARWRTRRLQHRLPPSEAPAWRGESLAGKTILLWAEQGFGDTLQFVRFARPLLDAGARVLLLAPPSLQRLLGRLDARLQVIGAEAPLPAHAVHCPLMSLPYWLGITDESAFGRAPYLHADAADVARWQSLLGERRRPRIGLIWAGRQNQINPGRDIPLRALRGLLDSALDVDWISLQAELPPDDLAVLSELPTLQHCAEGFSDFADTAALMSCLDLVISVDSAAAHLAGALGRPCWLLLRKSGEWRWQQARSDSPWYGTMRLFRQHTEGDWAGLLAQVGVALEAEFGVA
jgi:tetratricopeptide (TPR) repeat protein